MVWGSMPPDPLNGLGLMIELILDLESQEVSYDLESGIPVSGLIESCLKKTTSITDTIPWHSVLLQKKVVNCQSL